jgi:ABC-type transport system involved in Fe-S cluster assembly fused permease/ATPase subunit
MTNKDKKSIEHYWEFLYSFKAKDVFEADRLFQEYFPHNSLEYIEKHALAFIVWKNLKGK